MDPIPSGHIDPSVKIYFQVNSMENEQKMMELLEQFHPVDRTFSSLQLTLAHPEADFTSLVQGLTPLIDNSRDSIVLLYCCEGEDHILDLGVRMKIEYS